MSEFKLTLTIKTDSSQNILLSYNPEIRIDNIHLWRDWDNTHVTIRSLNPIATICWPMITSNVLCRPDPSSHFDDARRALKQPKISWISVFDDNFSPVLRFKKDVIMRYFQEIADHGFSSDRCLNSWLCCRALVRCAQKCTQDTAHGCKIYITIWR